MDRMCAVETTMTPLSHESKPFSIAGIQVRAMRAVQLAFHPVSDEAPTIKMHLNTISITQTTCE